MGSESREPAPSPVRWAPFVFPLMVEEIGSRRMRCGSRLHRVGRVGSGLGLTLARVRDLLGDCRPLSWPVCGFWL